MKRSGPTYALYPPTIIRSTVILGQDPNLTAFKPFPRPQRPSLDSQPPPSKFDSSHRSSQAPSHFYVLNRFTSHLVETYKRCNPNFIFESRIQRRILTKPNESVGNDGYDNENADYILYANSVLQGNKAKYLVLDMLGQGTFGQVVRCRRMDTHDQFVAIKVIKNKPAYFNQALVEINILEMLNTVYDRDGEGHIYRLLDHFVFRAHLCLVFELLGHNLYQLMQLKQENQRKSKIKQQVSPGVSR